MKAAFFGTGSPTGGNGNIDYVYGGDAQARVGRLVELLPVLITHDNVDEHAQELADLEVIFSTWGMPALSPAQIARMPRLKAVLYAAGSVQHFARPFLEKGIAVSSAYQANGVPVAEFCLAQILLACKRYFTCAALVRGGRWAHDAIGHGVYGETVALIGMGAVARQLVALLRPFNLRIIAVDIVLKEAEARALGLAKLVSIDEAFREAYVVSNHLPNLPHLAGVIGRAQFESMRTNATFINTGRGAQVDEAALIEVFGRRPDLTALLDVTDPEPLDLQGPLNRLPNVHVSPHMAGSANHEVLRMADYMIEECERLLRGEPLRYAVDLEKLAIMA